MRPEGAPSDPGPRGPRELPLKGRRGRTSSEFFFSKFRAHLPRAERREPNWKRREPVQLNRRVFKEEERALLGREVDPKKERKGGCLLEGLSAKGSLSRGLSLSENREGPPGSNLGAPRVKKERGLSRGEGPSVQR